MSTIPIVVFSDLDGTLLDHETYDWSPAKPALDLLKSIPAPVILCSSKTAPEVAVLQEAMGLTDYPAIVENGAGTIGAEQSRPSVALYKRLREVLDSIPANLRKDFAGFGDMSDEEVAEITGLSVGGATRARDRSFSEPGLWYGSDADRESFIAALAHQGVSAREGGRFLTLSFGRTKGDAMAQLATRFAPARTIALGDAPNDIEMIAAADYGVIVANPQRNPLPELAGEREGRIRRTTQPGPEGWNKAIHDLVQELNLA
ncbi:HAD-IIB family hydrolase [Sulfitobacter sp. HNIBRBA3233]|uniref:HAD-IIB family hydrolase n=1 Tax=Sulfitobacter marinivivus TaxID=3158558 RepID=UPI0032DE76BD